MSDDAMVRFRTFLAGRVGVADPDHELLRHEMGATINRHRLTGKDEGIQSFNTSQLSWLVVSNVGWTRTQTFVVGLMLSSLIDGDYEVFAKAKAEGLIPTNWQWVAWADGFSGTGPQLMAKLGTIADLRQRCGAACLAVRTSPAAITPGLLDLFCNETLATVYHVLLRTALRGPQATEIAKAHLTRLAERLDVLFAADTDATLAALVRASDLDQPDTVLQPFKDAAGDLTRVAVAQRLLERGRPQEALDRIKDLRFLSPAYDQAIIVAALAALECGKLEQVEFYTRNIADEDTRLKIVTRLAQARGDAAAEVDALSRLYERNHHDAPVFVQLINVLLRIGQTALAKALCADAQERFDGDAMVDAVIRRVLAE